MKQIDPPEPTDDLPEVIIPKENAVFWMDGQGRWHNRHGRFEHKRIIDYFNRAIRWDEDGFFVTQIRGNVREKVYFPYDDTPLFVFRIIENDPLELVLNTGEKVTLDPARLYVEGDHLYFSWGDKRIKFTGRAMMAISSYLEDAPDGLYFRIGDRHWSIPERGLST